MKTFYLIAGCLFLVAGTASAQAHAHGASADSAKGHSMEHMSGWKELDGYHTVMMQVWHPAKEKNDLAPIKAQATKLADAADVWAKAAIPSACDTPDTRSGIARLQADSRGLASLVAAGSDAQIMEALKALHDRFETINKSCKVGSHH